MGAKFIDNLPGVQIYWKEESEREFLGYGVLAGKSMYTSGEYFYGGKVYRYMYPVRAVRQGTRLTLEYRKEPDGWRSRWSMYKGTLTITFTDSQSHKPSDISWLIENESASCQLLQGIDWVFYSGEDVCRVQYSPRGRLKSTRTVRPEQKQMRDRLLSMYGGCQITGVQAPEALEACHVVPVKNGGDDSLANSLLLRRDLHALFDAGMLRFIKNEGQWSLHVSPCVSDQMYRDLHGRILETEMIELHAAHLEARWKIA